MFFNGLHDGLDLGTGEEDELRPAQEGQVHGHGHPVDVEEGDGPEDHLLPLPEVGDPGPHLEGVGGEVPVGEHRPLGEARGAPGVLEEGEVVQVQGHGAGRSGPEEGPPGEALEGLVGFPFPPEKEGVEEVLGEGEVVLDPRAHHLLHGHLPLHLQVAGEELVQDHQEPGPGVPELVVKLPWGVHGVGVHPHAPGEEGAVEGDDELGRVGEHEGHPVPGL